MKETAKQHEAEIALLKLVVGLVAFVAVVFYAFSKLDLTRGMH